MKSFEEIRFPNEISYGSRGGPRYSTDIIENFAGYEQRNINWSSSRARYNVSHGVKSVEQIEDIIKFFHARRGRAVGFRFKDWTDYIAAKSLIAVADGTMVGFQLVKRYSNGSTTLAREIKKPVDNEYFNVYVNEELCNKEGYSVDFTTGIITFNEPPVATSIIKADFEFDVPVRFDTDVLDISIDDFETHSWSDIPLIEIRI